MNLDIGILSAAADGGGGGGARHAGIVTLPPLITTNWMHIFQQADLSVVFCVVWRLLSVAVIT